MFKVLAGDYGSPPSGASWLFGQFILTPSDDVKLSNFNNEHVSGTDYISLDKSNCHEFKLEDSVEEEKTNEGTDLVKELEKLGALKEKGLLTDEEFSAAKAKLLS